MRALALHRAARHGNGAVRPEVRDDALVSLLFLSSSLLSRPPLIRSDPTEYERCSRRADVIT